MKGARLTSLTSLLVSLSLGVSLSGCPRKEGPTTPPPQPAPQKLTYKPKELDVIAVPGAELIVAPSFRLLRLEGSLVKHGADLAALAAKAQQCAGGSRCGARMSSSEVASLYVAIERAEWRRGALDGELSAGAEGGGASMFFVGPRISPEVLANGLVAGKWCGPGGGAACPPVGPPPRSETRPQLRFEIDTIAGRAPRP